MFFGFWIYILKSIYLGDDINDFRGYNDWIYKKRKELKVRKKL